MNRDATTGNRGIRGTAPLALVLVLGGLALPLSAAGQPAGRPATPADCRAHGGSWKKVGLAGTEECDLPARDAGRACSDDSECEAACITNDKTPAGSPATGHCFPRTTLTGQCLNRVRGGKALGLACAD